MTIREYAIKSAEERDESFRDGMSSVTVLMYFFWPIEHASIEWPRFQGALLETWRHCGRLKSVIVVNVGHECVRRFAEKYPWTEIQIEPSLVPGDINSMSIDCILRLHRRFETQYVLTIQDDGFPLRPGIEQFVKAGYDYVGAPYCRPCRWPDFLTRVLNYCPQNGGFSLRSHKICRLAAKYYQRYYADKPFEVATMSEDLFYTMTLPRRHFLFWVRRRQAPSSIAAEFSLEHFASMKGNSFGFHSETGWRKSQELKGENR